MIEDGKTIVYNVFRNGKKIGELKRLVPGIDMIVNTCQTINTDINEYSIVDIFTNNTVWSGSQYANRDPV